jgi:hypothetical protein
MNEHVEQLAKAREQLVNQRRLIAKTLAGTGSSEKDCEKFNQLQATIEAIDAAIEDEQLIEDGAQEDPEE